MIIIPINRLHLTNHYFGQRLSVYKTYYDENSREYYFNLIISIIELECVIRLNNPLIIKDNIRNSLFGRV